MSTETKLNPIETLFLSWVNDFLTVSAFAEYYGISEKLASDIINAGRNINNGVESL